MKSNHYGWSPGNKQLTHGVTSVRREVDKVLEESGEGKIKSKYSTQKLLQN